MTYFPHLIAGPILHHKEMMPQFEEENTYRLDTQELLGCFQPALDFRSNHGRQSVFAWRPSITWAAAGALVAVCGLLSLSRVSEFLYYQF